MQFEMLLITTSHLAQQQMEALRCYEQKQNHFLTDKQISDARWKALLPRMFPELLEHSLAGRTCNSWLIQQRTDSLLQVFLASTMVAGTGRASSIDPSLFLPLVIKN